ncbi:MAG: hypothetical protein J6Y37_05775 [Paludibacteraceae bacterium]|nr:hypothetical protein [Paludibacteraceae bacterium]
MNAKSEEKAKEIIEKLEALQKEAADVFSELQTLAEEESDGDLAETLKNICEDYASELDGNFESAIDDIDTLLSPQGSSLRIDVKFE